MWVPGHVGIRGNEAAVRTAKELHHKRRTDDLLPFSDLYTWEWDETVLVFDKFRHISPELADKLLSICNTRKAVTVFQMDYKVVILI